MEKKAKSNLLFKIGVIILMRKHFLIRYLSITIILLYVAICSAQTEKANLSGALPWNKLQSLSGKEFKLLYPSQTHKIRFGISIMPGINIYNSGNVISENKIDLLNKLYNNPDLMKFLLEQMEGEFEIFQTKQDERRLVASDLAFKTEAWMQIAENIMISLYYYRGRFIHSTEMLASSASNMENIFNQKVIAVSSGIKASGFGAAANYQFTKKHIINPYAGLDIGLQHLERNTMQASFMNSFFDLTKNDLTINQLIASPKFGSESELVKNIWFRIEIVHAIPISNKHPINPNPLSIYTGLRLQLF